MRDRMKAALLQHRLQQADFRLRIIHYQYLSSPQPHLHGEIFPEIKMQLCGHLVAGFAVHAHSLQPCCICRWLTNVTVLTARVAARRHETRLPSQLEIPSHRPAFRSASDENRCMIFVQAQRHRMNRLNLLAAFGRASARLEQQQVGVAENGSERVVDARPHFEHVAPERGVALAREREAFGALRAPKRFDTPKRFDGDQDQSADPVDPAAARRANVDIAPARAATSSSLFGDVDRRRDWATRRSRGESRIGFRRAPAR